MTLDYMFAQADTGAQAVQIFDSWATELSPVDFEVGAAVVYCLHLIRSGSVVYVGAGWRVCDGPGGSCITSSKANDRTKR